MASLIGRPLGLVLADAASTAAPHAAGMTAAAYFSHHIALARSVHNGASGRVAWAAEPSWEKGDALLGARPSGTSLQTVPAYPRGVTYAKVRQFACCQSLSQLKTVCVNPGEREEGNCHSQACNRPILLHQGIQQANCYT